MEKQPTAERLLGDDERLATPWPEGRRRFAEADTFWPVTVGPDGGPHVRPILPVWPDDALCFVASATSRKARNLVHDAHCAITTETDDADLVIEGEAAIVRNETTLRRVAARYAAKYDWHVIVRDGAFHAEGVPTAGPPPYDVYALTPHIAFSFGQVESFSPTRWRF